ncbi:hemerythrin domain-containing protein [Pseudooceanicola sp. 502str34]|uniref:hemerythrin domain-containing protein n=1 Tax=Maritimibacter alkaliphilus TaxID=404236 RepID=UPI001C973AAD|nr:hemerythrin domain-containing protein [Maritimibacter alkaliphilus]MBY6092042.1 hemerythrin domain-containing protein [Maritimibacter alkaliphilus]
MPSIYDAIKEDHDRHREWLNTIAETSGDSDTRREAWDAFYNDIKSHSAAEEETFYSKLMEDTWGQDAARHSVHEHAEMDEILEELREMDMSSPGWLTRFKTLKHDYEHHMEEEEDEVFTRAKKVIGAEHNDAFGKKFLDHKATEEKLVEKKREDALHDD